MTTRPLRFTHSTFLALVIIAAILSAPALAALQADPDAYLKHVKTLASPEWEGRGAGSEGLKRAARYIEAEFKSLGLEPAAGHGSYRQPFTVTTGAVLKGENSLAWESGEREVSLTPESDYIPMSFSAGGNVAGQVVFAGYGVSADEFGYDDYTHFDVADKIVVLLRYEPPELDGQEKAERGKEGPRRYTHHSRLITKLLNAHQHGARAVLLVNGRLEADEKDQLLRFGSVAGPEDAGLMMAQVSNAAAEEWFRLAGKSLADIQNAIDTDNTPQSFTFPESLQVSLQVDIERTRAEVNNILGYLPGQTDEYVVLGAHYDHLGLGSESSLAPSQIGTVHPGADDNASGTAGLLELARIFSARDETPKRGVLFIAFAGEEIGLLGSNHWVNHPTLPLENAMAMINLDMIGRIRDDKVFVGGVGTGSSFEKILDDASDRHGVGLEPSASGYSSSDHMSFLGKKIPVLFFFSGLHSDYHKPSDTWEKIESEAATRLVNLVSDVSLRLIGNEERPEFAAVAPPVPAGGVARGGGGYGPWFGSVPDFGEVKTGVKFADITPDSPADKAGIQPGDILIGFGDMEVKNLYDFTFALRNSKVGDVVTVKCLRGEKEMEFEVTLEQRR
jgi:hypothetical protein